MAETLDRASTAKSSEVRLTRPEGSVEVNTGPPAPDLVTVAAAVDPPVELIKQRSTEVCWAAAGTMMRNWKLQAGHTVEATMDAPGGPWRARYDANASLTAAQLRAFTAHSAVKGARRRQLARRSIR